MAVHVFIATTEGPSRIQRIAEEDSDIPSVVCLNGTTETLAISPDYGRFVKRGSGVVARLTGHDSYRVDVDQPIDGGRSWQLGLLLAHLLVMNDRFSGDRIAPNDTLILATGEVDRDLNLRPVGHIPEKIAQCAALLQDAAAQGVRVLFFLPDSEPELPDSSGSASLPKGVEFLPIATVGDAASVAGLPVPAATAGKPAIPDNQGAGQALGPAATPPPDRPTPSRSGIGPLGIALILLLLAGTSSVAAMRVAPEPTERFFTAYGPAGLSETLQQIASLIPGGSEPVDPDPVPTPDPDPVVTPEPEPNPDPAPEPELVVDPEPTPEPLPDPDPIAEPEPDPAPEPDPEQVAEADPIDPDSVVVAVAEERAPTGFTCASLRFTGDSTSTAALDAEPDGGFLSGETRALCGLTYGVVNRGTEEIVIAATIETASGTILLARRNMPVPAGEVVFFPLTREEIDWAGLTLRLRVDDTPEGARSGFDMERQHGFLE